MITVLLLALALSMDAFAAAICRGAAARPRATVGAAAVVGVAFGTAQAVMPLLGWGLGMAFASIVREVDHWIAFALLGLIGARMVQQGLTGDETCEAAPLAVGWSLFAAAVATSIDAAAAGVTLTLLDAPVLVSCAVIGITTLALSMGGVLLGGAVGAALGRKAEVAGGLVLIGLGVKILVEHQWLGG